MKSFLKVVTLNSTLDLLSKAKSDLERFKSDRGIYSMAGCFLTLNAIPEWASKDEEVADERLSLLNDEVMKCEKYDPVEGEFLDSIEQKLRFVRSFANHLKHSGSKQSIVTIGMTSGQFPISFPITFDKIKVTYTNGKIEPIDAQDLLESVVHFFEERLNTN